VLEPPQEYEKTVNKVQDWSTEIIWVRINFGILFPRKGSSVDS
jgi:hypothetical protein